MKKLTVIWDVTRLCPWDCKICCMGASTDRKCTLNELSLEQKQNVISQLEELKAGGVDVRVDMSGGEIMIDRNHLALIKMASEVLGKKAVGISTSGIGIDEETAEFLAQYTKDVEMTMDWVPGEEYDFRNKEYHETAARAVVALKKAGACVGIQTVLCRNNNTREAMSRLLKWICDHGVDNWSILRFFPSGRGQEYADVALNSEENREAVWMIQKLHRECKDPKPELDFHYLMPGHGKSTEVCRCVRKSVGILPDGTVVACFWALNQNMALKEDKFYLGNITEMSLKEILKSERAAYWLCAEHKCELGCA